MVMNLSKRKRVAGRVLPYDPEKMKAVLEKLGLTMSDEDTGIYQPWEERLMSAVNGLLQHSLASEHEAVMQALGQYKLFVYFLENRLPEIIEENPGASGKLLLAIAAHQYTTLLMLEIQKANAEAELRAAQSSGPEKMA